LSALSDGNGIYSGSGTVAANTVATIPATGTGLAFNYNSGNGAVSISDGGLTLGANDMASGIAFDASGITATSPAGSITLGTDDIGIIGNNDVSITATGDFFLHSSGGSTGAEIIGTAGETKLVLKGSNGDTQFLTKDQSGNDIVYQLPAAVAASNGDVLTSTTAGVLSWETPTGGGGATDLSISGTSSPLGLNSSTGTDVTLTAGTGITLAGSSSNATITNSAPDQTVAITGSGINVVTGTYPNFTVTGTEVDGSTTNELQTVANTSDATSHTVTLSNSGGSTKLVEGSNITLTTTGTTADGVVTIAATGDGGMTALTGDVTASGSGSVAATIANSAVTLAKQADVATSTVFYRKTAGTGAPEVQTLSTLKTDLGLTGTNSGDQTITNSSDATSHTVTLSNTGGSVQLVEGSGVTLTTTGTGSAGVVTIASTGGGGTVTATGGALTANAVVLGAGTTDTKVSTGITTDGTAALTLGVNATTIGTVKMFGNTSGDVTIQPTAAAGTATVQTFPATTGTLVNRVTTGNGVSASNTDGALSFTLGAITPTTVNGNTFTTGSSTYTGTAAQTYTFPATTATIARTDAANTFTGVQTFSTPIATASVATMTATVGGGVPTPPNNTTTFLRGDGTFAAPSAGSGDITNGGNTTGAAVTIGTNDAFGLNLETNNVTRVAITGGASTGGAITTTDVTANTNTVESALTVQANSSGTAAAGFGPAILFQGESSTTNNRDMASISAIWTTATDASRASAITFKALTAAGALSEAMRITGDGKLGLGVISPASVFEVSTDGTSSPFFSTLYNAGASSAPANICRRARGTQASPTAVQSADALGGVYAVGYDGTSFSSTNSGAIKIQAAENFTTSAHGSYISFETTLSGGLSRTEKARISDSGKFGIGTTTPTALVHMAAGTATANTAPLKFTSGTNLTAVEAGAVEFDGTDFFVSSGSTRYYSPRELHGSATLNFGSTAAGASTDLTVTVTGAADGDVVSIGVPNGSTLTNGCFTAWVSAANTVTIRFSNNDLITALDPASGTFKAFVTK
jgi:hypothetical protein